MNWLAYNDSNKGGRFLYKFLAERWLREFLRTGNIWFSRSDVFGDKMECVTINDLMSGIVISRIEGRKKRHLISCFHQGMYESLAFWDTYAKTDSERRKYALRFDKLKLVELISSSSTSSPKGLKTLVHGGVVYKNLIGANLQKLSTARVKYPSLRKERAFEYEREYRFVISLDSNFPEAGYNIYLGEPSSLPFSVLVNPLLADKEFIESYKVIERLGFKDKRRLSGLAKWVKPKIMESINKRKK